MRAMAKRAPVNLSRVVKKATALETLVDRDLESQRSKFNLTDQQWKTIADGRSAKRRGFFRSRSRRSTAA